MYDASSIALAFSFTLLAGLSTGIGGFLGVLKHKPGAAFMAGSLGLSAGVMVYVSFMEMLPAANDYLDQALGESVGGWAMIGAFLAGVALIALIDRFVPEEINPHEPSTVEGAAGAARRSRIMKAGLISAAALAIHNFPEGFATFIAALEDPAIAVPIVVAIAIHNIPEGIAVAVPIREATGSRQKGFWLATLSGLAEPLGALIGFLILMPFIGPGTMGVSYAVVAGIMVFVSLDELLPTAQATGKHHHAVYGLVAGMAVMGVSLLMLN